MSEIPFSSRGASLSCGFRKTRLSLKTVSSNPLCNFRHHVARGHVIPIVSDSVFEGLLRAKPCIPAIFLRTPQAGAERLFSMVRCADYRRFAWPALSVFDNDRRLTITEIAKMLARLLAVARRNLRNFGTERMASFRTSRRVSPPRQWQ